MYNVNVCFALKTLDVQSKYIFSTVYSYQSKFHDHTIIDDDMYVFYNDVLFMLLKVCVLLAPASTDAGEGGGHILIGNFIHPSILTQNDKFHIT